jgi:hypothetical protein
LRDLLFNAGPERGQFQRHFCGLIILIPKVHLVCHEQIHDQKTGKNQHPDYCKPFDQNGSPFTRARRLKNGNVISITLGSMACLQAEKLFRRYPTRTFLRTCLDKKAVSGLYIVIPIDDILNTIHSAAHRACYDVAAGPVPGRVRWCLPGRERLLRKN